MTTWLLAGTFAASLVLTGVVRASAGLLRLVDVPNDRSSHTTPTARGGGLAIAVVVLLAFGALAAKGCFDSRTVIGFGGSAAAIAAVGILDDRFSVRASIRLLIHVAAACWFLIWCWAAVPYPEGGQAPILLAGWTVLLVIGLVGVVNVVNFMDGIDGLGASQAIFMAAAGAWLVGTNGDGACVQALLGVLAAASAGFLLWNISPLRIFLGDVGSGFLGFALAGVFLLASGESDVPLATWVILGSPLLADAGLTLFRRVARGDRWYEAHRSHAYQNLARHYASHRLVTLLYLLVSVVWLLPLAWFSVSFPAYAEVLALIGLVPLIGIAWRLGAGAASA